MLVQLFCRDADCSDACALVLVDHHGRGLRCLFCSDVVSSTISFNIARAAVRTEPTLWLVVEVSRRVVNDGGARSSAWALGCYLTKHRKQIAVSGDADAEIALSPEHALVCGESCGLLLMSPRASV